MSTLENDRLLDWAAEALSESDEPTRAIIERCLDNNDLEGLQWALTHLEERDVNGETSDQAEDRLMDSRL